MESPKVNERAVDELISFLQDRAERIVKGELPPLPATHPEQKPA